MNTRQHGPKTGALLGLARRQAHGAIGAPMEGPLKGNNLVAPRRVAHEFDGALDSFGT